MSNIADIVKGINQAAANAHDGAIDAEGEPLDIGLERNKSVPISDRRIMDGFGVTVSGTTMRVNYTRELPSKDVADNKLKSKIENSIEEVTKFLKKEYKNLTGEALKLKKKGQLEMGNVQSTSRVRSWVQAHCEYEIQGATGLDVKDKDDVDAAIKSFLALGNNAKKSPNVSITPKDNEK